MAEVGSGQVAIFPTFKGFRSSVTAETSGAGREGGKTFSSAFNAGAGDPAAALVKKLNAQIASGSSALSKARLAEQDAAGRVRVAEAALNEARSKGGAETSRSIAAEERLEAAKRKLTEASSRTKTASDQLRDSQARLADATSAAGSSGEQASRRYATGWQGLRQRLSGVVKGAVDDAGDSAKASADRSGRESGGAFSGAFKGAIGALAGVFAVDQLVGGFKSAVTAAGNLEQSAGAIQSVFKESSADMLRWSSDASNAVGLTQNEFNELGTLIGSQLKNGGTAMDELAPKTNELITLGADLSSMFGGTTADAVGALSSALKGETDPIERYGVSLSAAKVEAEAMAMGAEKVGGELSAQAKQAAILSLVMKQTGDAQGNFAKESETLAGQQQRMTAGWKDISAGIGGIFLPVLTTLFGFINSSILPVIDSFVSRLGDEGLAGVFPRLASSIGLFLSGLSIKSEFAGQLTGIAAFGSGVRSIFDSIRPFFAAFAATWAPLIPTVLGFVSAFSPLSLIFQAIQPILPNIAGLFQILGLTLGTVLTGALTQLTPLMSTLVGVVSGVLVAVMPAVNAMFVVFSEALVSLVPVLVGVLGAVLPLVGALLTQLAPVITSLITSILPPLVSIFGNIVNSIGPLVAVIAGLLIPAVQALLPVVVTVFSVIADVITSVMRIIQGVIQVVTGAISGDWAQVWTGILNVVGGVFDLIVSLISGAIQLVMSVVLNGLNAVVSFWTAAWAGIVAYLGTSVRSILTGAQGMLDDLVGFFGGIGNTVINALGDMGGLLLGSGQALIQGFIDGINGMAGAIGDAVGGVLDIARQFFPSSPAKRGPFSGRGYTSFSGQALAKDFAGGISSQQGTVASAASRLMSSASLSLNAAGVGSASVEQRGVRSAVLPPVYVQNPFTGAYLLAQVGEVASGVVSVADSSSQYMRRGR